LKNPRHFYLKIVPLKVTDKMDMIRY